MLRLSQRGETIVEVLIVVAILSGVLGGAFAISTRSQRTLQSNQERFQAQLIVNQQADLIKLLQADGTKKQAIINLAQAATPFCIDVTTGTIITTMTDTACNPPYGTAFNFTLSVMPSHEVNVGDVFVITVTWPTIQANGSIDTVRLVYGT